MDFCEHCGLIITLREIGVAEEFVSKSLVSIMLWSEDVLNWMSSFACQSHEEKYERGMSAAYVEPLRNLQTVSRHLSVNALTQEPYQRNEKGINDRHLLTSFLSACLFVGNATKCCRKKNEIVCTTGG